MKNYLSIGDVARIKGVGIKSLRYYDEIGILKPAYVNPDTGYRYYRPEQLITLDVIFTCIELGIPLKSFHRYRTDTGVLMVSAILEEGRKLAQQKIAKINGNVAQMENLSEHIAAYQLIKNEQGDYQRQFEQRRVLVSPWTGDIGDSLLYAREATKLYFRAKKLELIPLYQMGLMLCHTTDGVRQYAFTEVSGSAEADDLIALPAGSYCCRLYHSGDGEEIDRRYLASPWQAGTVIMVCEIYDAQVDGTPVPIEIQVFKR